MKLGLLSSQTLSKCRERSGSLTYKKKMPFLQSKISLENTQKLHSIVTNKSIYGIRKSAEALVTMHGQ